MNIIKATDRIRIIELADKRLAIEIEDDGIWRTATRADTYEAARPLANLAHRIITRGGDAADAIIAILTTRAEQTTRRFVGMDMGEAVWGEINIHLGMCPDGCCGGPEVLPESELPAWNAYRDRLTKAVDRNSGLA